MITVHGRPVARIEPVDDVLVTAQEEKRAQRDEAWKALIDRVSSQPIKQSEPWTREELYEDEVEP